MGKTITYALCLLVLLLCGKVGYGQLISTVAGNGLLGSTGNGGPATAARLHGPYGGAFDRKGSYYFVEPGNNVIRRVLSTGIIELVGGTGVAGFSGDGGSATVANFRTPLWVTCDRENNVYIADAGNKRIRKIDTFGVVTTVAGNGSSGLGGEGGPATSASLTSPSGVFVDSFFQIYICDNSRILKVGVSGILTRVAGNGTAGYSGDGGNADSASIQAHQVVVDSSSNVYILDFNRIRKVSASTHIISTVAGTGSAIYNGDNISAITANIMPIGLIWDNYNNLYTADLSNNRVRKINTFGVITTVAGNGLPMYAGDGGRADSASMYDPSGLAFDVCGNLFITVKQDYRIRKVTYNPHCWPLDVPDAEEKPELSVYPIPATATLHISGAEANTTYVLYAVTGQVVATGMLLQRDTEVDIDHLAPGMYLLQVQDANGVRSTHKVFKE